MGALHKSTIAYNLALIRDKSLQKSCTVAHNNIPKVSLSTKFDPILALSTLIIASVLILIQLSLGISHFLFKQVKILKL